MCIYISFYRKCVYSLAQLFLEILTPLIHIQISAKFSGMANSSSLKQLETTEQNYLAYKRL